MGSHTALETMVANCYAANKMREMPRKQTSVVVVFPSSAASNCWPVSGSTLPPRVSGGTAWYVLRLEASGVLEECSEEKSTL